MHMKKIVILICLAMGLVCSCRIDDEYSNDLKDTEGVEMIFHASNMDNSNTKTVLNEDNLNIMWSAADGIKLFYGADISAKFTSTNTEAATNVDFSGTLKNFQYNSTTSFTAVYPYSNKTSFDGEAITVTLPAEQTAVAGSFASDLLISVAQSQDENLHFYNLCGGVRFQVAEEGVKSVRLMGCNGETLAGTVKVKLDSDGKPYVSEICDTLTSITLNAPDGGEFKTGVYYYFVALPASLENGYSMRFIKSRSYKEYKSQQSSKISRSCWGSLSASKTAEAKDGDYVVIAIDSTETFWSVKTNLTKYLNEEHTQSEDITLVAGINFIDSPKYGFKVRGTYVLDVDMTHWDKSCVKSTENMFTACTRLTSIDLSGFSAVVNANSMFSHCYALTKVNGLKDMVNLENSGSMFYYSNALSEGIDLSGMKNLQDASSMFYKCDSLVHVTGLGELTNLKNASHMFWSCGGLEEIDGLSELTNLENASCMFYGTSLKKTPDLSGLKNLTDASCMFAKTKFTTPPDLSPLENISNVSYMFYGAAITTPPAINVLSESVNAAYMFAESAIEYAPDFSDVKFGVGNAAGMFHDCRYITELDLADFEFTVKIPEFFPHYSSCSKIITHVSDETHLDNINKSLIALLEEYRSVLKTGWRYVITQGETSSDGVTIFTINPKYVKPQ